MCQCRGLPCRSVSLLLCSILSCCCVLNGVARFVGSWRKDGFGDKYSVHVKSVWLGGYAE
mgnify:FL=1